MASASTSIRVVSAVLGSRSPAVLNAAPAKDVGERGQDRQTLLAFTVELLFLLDVGGADGLDAVHLLAHPECFVDEPLRGPHGIASGREAGDRRFPCPAGCDVVVEVSELVEVPDAQEAVAGLEGVVQEREGPILGHRGEPHRQLGHLDGHRVAVHAIAAVLGHQAAGLDHYVEPVRVVSGGGGLGGPGVALGSPRLDEPVGEVAAGGDEDGARPDGRVADLQVDDVVRGADAPLVRVGGVLGARRVAQRGEGVLGDLVGEFLGGVGGAAVASRSGLSDVHSAFEEHERPVAEV